jgi:hypothetical protein
MCHYDEVVRSVAGSAAGWLTARRSWFQPAARYRAARAAIVPRTTTRPSAAPEKQGDNRSGLAAGIDPAAYWGHGPDHRGNPWRDPRRMACRHGCGRDRGYGQDVCYRRADRNGRIRRRVARGQAPWSRLAAQPLRAPDAEPLRGGGRPGRRIRAAGWAAGYPEVITGPGMSMATRDTDPAVTADSGSLPPGLSPCSVASPPALPRRRAAGERLCAVLLDVFAVPHAERAGSRRGATG